MTGSTDKSADRGVIRLYLTSICCVTVEEFDAITRELTARKIAGDVQIGDRILAQLLNDRIDRRNELAETPEQRAIRLKDNQ